MTSEVPSPRFHRLLGCLHGMVSPKRPACLQVLVTIPVVSVSSRSRYGQGACSRSKREFCAGLLASERFDYEGI